MTDDDRPNDTVAVVGLDACGLSVAIALAREFSHVIAYDDDEARIARLRAGEDPSCRISSETLRAARCHFTSDPQALSDARFILTRGRDGQLSAKSESSSGPIRRPTSQRHAACKRRQRNS